MAGKTLETTIEIAGVLSPSLQKSIQAAIDRLDEMSKETLDTAGAAEKLAMEISTQEDVLKKLQQGYEDFVVAGDESSESAKQLAEHIQDVSAELDGNKDVLKAAQEAAEKLTESQEDTGDAYDRLQKQISEQEDTLNTLRRSYANVVLEQGEGSDAAKDLASQIQKVSSELDDNQEALKAAQEAADKLTESQKDAGDAYERLESQIAGQEEQLASLRRAYANVSLEQGESSDEARKLASQITQLSGDLTTNRQRLSAADQAADQLGASLEDAGQMAAESGDGYTVLKDVLADLISNGIDKAKEGLETLMLEGDSSLSMLEARTGASSAEMEKYKDVMYDVYNSNYGESLSDVSDAMSTVIQMTDDLDKASLEQVTKNAIVLEDVFGYDTTESLRTVNSMMDQFGISADEAFNLVVQGAQNGLDQNGDLLDTLNEYSVHFSQLGMSAEDMMNVLANGAENGTFSIDKLGDTVKEFGIRVIDDSDSTAKAFKDLGLDVEEMEDLFTAGGESASEAFQETLKRLGEVDNKVWQNQIGVALFGTMWEDLGAETVLAMGNAEGAIDSTVDAMGQLDSAAYDNLESSLSQLGRTVSAEILQPIAEKLTPVLKDGVDFINDHVGPAVDYLIERLPTLGAVIGAIGTAIAGIKIASFVKKIGKLVGLLKGKKLGGIFDSLGLGGTSSGDGLFGGFKKLAETSTKTVLKGMTNMTIILGGLGALTAAAALVAPTITSMCDSGEFARLMVAIGIVGLVGAGMASLAGKIGDIPVATATKGLANMAIVLGGLGVLTTAIALIAPTVTSLCDSGTFTKLLTTISITGAAGSALAGLSGVIGKIPISAVLTGLGDIALALGGVTAIVTAFAALNQIDGFQTFITSGGDLLAEIFRIIGEVSGSVIGGLGEGVTNSLPQIGANLSDFAASIQPMFETISGVDVSGVADFAGALASLVAVIAGEKIVSVITGGIDYTQLGTDLNSMATELGGFFATVMAFPEGGFERANALFDCLAGIKSLPKEGGVIGWFEGEVDYAKMSTGLNQLAGAAGFFSTIQGIPEDAFAKATALFECLAGIKSLPQDGGVVGWFTGEVDFSKIASGIQSLAGEGMISALAAISNIPESGFSSLTALFEALAGIKTMPKEGGIAGWFSGDSSTGLTNISSQLPEVGANIAAFFDSLGGRTDFSPISGLFNTLSNIEINTDVAEKGFWSGVSQLGSMGTELANFANNASTFFTMINGLNLENLSGFWDALGGAGGLPESLATLNTSVGTELSGIEETVTASMENVNADVLAAMTLAASVVTLTLASISTQFTTSGTSIKSSVQSTTQTVQTSFQTAMANAQSVVSSGLAAISSMFANVQLQLPHIDLPHFNVAGTLSLNPPQVPEISVSWYKEGGILTEPTLFGLAGGEAGDEAVVPLEVLWNKLSTMIQEVFNSASTTGGEAPGLTATAGKLLAIEDFSLGSLANDARPVVYYDFSGFTWSPQIQVEGDTDEDTFMAQLKAHEAEFFDWLEEFVQMREEASYA